MKNQPKKNNSATPIIIIGLVLIIALGGGALLYRSANTAKPKTTNTNTTANKSATPDTRAQTAPAGAMPPNMLGSPTATVTIEEFADFQCPQCASKYPLAKEIISIYGNRIKFIYRNYPLSIPAHDKAYTASVAAEAAGLQNKFWDMQNQLFTNQSSWSSATDFNSILEQYAQKIGLDVEKFKNDMAGLQTKQRVDADLARGRGMGVNSTPSFFINGKAIPFEQTEITTMRQIIDAELLKTQGGNQTSPQSGGANPNPSNTNSTGGTSSANNTSK
jgi:protein-disulfide isomerase